MNYTLYGGLDPQEFAPYALWFLSIFSTYPHNMVNFGLLAAEIDPVVWGTPAVSTSFASWQP